MKIKIVVMMCAALGLPGVIFGQHHAPLATPTAEQSITGDWVIHFQAGHKSVPGSLQLQANGERLAGTIETSHTGPGTVENGKWSNEKLEATLVFKKHESVVLEGELTSNGTLAGNYTTEGRTEAWQAERKSATALLPAAATTAPRHAIFAADANAKLELPPEGASMPMLDIGGRPVVEVKISGKGPFPFILDTGATQTVIDPGLSEELASSGDHNPIKELTFGPVKATGVEALVLPVTAMFGKIDKPPRGALSAQSFPGYLLCFDYPGKKITLRKGALPDTDGRAIFAYGADDPLPVVPLKVGGEEVKVNLDTGAPFALALPTKYKDQLRLAVPAVEKGKAITHSGEFPIFKGTVDGDIEIGEFKLRSRDLAFTDVALHPQAVPQGQLGYAALRDFVVTLDSANRRVQFARP
jgi:hypothetical protein